MRKRKILNSKFKIICWSIRFEKSTVIFVRIHFKISTFPCWNNNIYIYIYIYIYIEREREREREREVEWVRERERERKREIAVGPTREKQLFNKKEVLKQFPFLALLFLFLYVHCCNTCSGFWWPFSTVLRFVSFLNLYFYSGENHITRL